MTYKLATIALFAVCFAVVSSRPEAGFDCKGKQDGLYADPVDVQGYYVCFEEESVIRLKCPKGNVFDSTVNNCVSENENENEDTQNLAELDDDSSDDDMESLKSQLEALLSGEEISFPGEDAPSNSSYSVYNVQVKKNIFPGSVVMVGQGNREQKNK